MPGVLFSTIHKGENLPLLDISEEPLPQKRFFFSLRLPVALLAILALFFILFKGWLSSSTVILDVPSRHRDFVGREEELDYLKRQLLNSRDCNVVVIYGEGGIGKTELATAFSRDHIRNFSLIALIDGSNEEATLRSYESLGDVWNIKEQDFKRLREKVHRKLENLQGKPWLLIFDDIRNPLTDFPQSGGRVLITCRDKSVFSSHAVLELTPSPEQAVQLLAQLTGEEKAENLQRLARQLDYLPLMINIAGHYIAETPGINIANYTDMLSSIMGTERSPLQAKEIGNRYPRSLAATYSITMELLQKKHPLSFEFLKCVIYLHHKNIPTEFLTRWLEGQHKYTPTEQVLLQGDILRELQNHSLARYDSQSESFTMHELLHLALREKFRKDISTIETFHILAACDAILHYNPTRKETIRPFQKNLSHCMTLLEAVENPSPQTAHLALTVSRYFLDTEHDLIMGEKYLSWAKKWTHQSYHPIEGRIAFLYGVLRYRQAEKLSGKQEKYAQALEFFNEAFAYFQMYNKDSDYKKIEQNPSKCTKEYQRAICLQYQGQMLRLLGRLDESEKRLQQALQAFQQIAQGQDHFDIARILREQGLILREKGEYRAAVQKIEDALSMQKRTYGSAYTSQSTVAATYQTLGDLLFQLGEFSKSDQSYQISININKEAYQTDTHPYLVDLYHRRSAALLSLDKKRKAQKMKEEAQAIQARLK